MNARSILRFVVGAVIAAGLLTLALPLIGIPRSHLLPPAVVYEGARGRAWGVVSRRRQRETSNLFRVGDQVYFVDYRFVAKAPATLGVARPGAAKTYYGTVRVSAGLHDATRPGARLPVRYELTYPDINGVDLPGYGRSEGEGSQLLSGWIFWALASLVLGYALSPLLERIWPRGDL